MQWLFWIITKIKKWFGLAFGAHFMHYFSIIFFFYLIPYIWTKFQGHTFFSSQDMKQNMLLSSYLDN